MVNDTGTAMALFVDENTSSSAAATENGYVTCPVCGSKIRGDDYIVNSHLDLCLVRGTKRKLSQRTLLQFSFCSKLKSETQADEAVYVATDEVQNQIGQNSEPKLNDFPHSASFDSQQLPYDNNQLEMARLHDPNPSKSSLASGSTTKYDTKGSMEKNFTEDNINSMVETPLSSLRSGSPSFDVAGAPGLLSGMALETYIVGRRFCDEAEVISGASISLLRDPVNVKDPNAIKVISKVFEGNRVLGFLPRELAQHLSPLIDKYKLNFEELYHRD